MKRNGKAGLTGGDRLHGGPLRLVPIATVLAAGIQRRLPPAGATRTQVRYYKGMLSCFRTLGAYWGDRLLAEVNEATSRGYVAHRMSQGIRLGSPDGTGSRARLKEPSGKRRGVAWSTAVSELEVLKTEAHHYGQEHGHSGLVNMPLTRQREGKELILEDAEIRRILLACLGCRFDPGTRRFSHVPRFRQVRLFREPLIRMILVTRYTGSESGCIGRLRWRGDPDGTESYLNLEEAKLYRLGPDAAVGKAAGMPVPIPYPLLIRLRRWRDQDEAKGFGQLIHVRGRKEAHEASLTKSFRAACRDAGLPDEVTISTVRFATGVSLMRQGCPTRAAAYLMGLDLEYFERAFAEHRPDFQEAAIRALASKAKSIISVKRSGGTNDWERGPERGAAV